MLYPLNFLHSAPNKLILCSRNSLAYAELYLTIASIFRRFEMELVDTTIEDVRTVHDFFVSAPGLNSHGVQVRITGEISR